MEDHETPETQETQQTQETQDELSAPEDPDAIRAQLDEEKKAKAAAQAALAEKDRALSAMSARQAELQAEGEALRAERSNLQAELASLNEAHAQAVAKYLGAVRAANASIPQDIIVGQTIEEIDGSLERAQAIATAVKANLEAQAKEAKVPAGAPTRGEISLEGLTPREKIAYGIMSLRGTQ